MDSNIATAATVSDAESTSLAILIVVVVILCVACILVLWKFGCKKSGRSTTIRMHGTSVSSRYRGSVLDTPNCNGYRMVKLVQNVDGNYVLIPNRDKRGDMVSQSSQTDIGYETDPDRFADNEMAAMQSEDTTSEFSAVAMKIWELDLELNSSLTTTASEAIAESDVVSDGLNQNSVRANNPLNVHEVRRLALKSIEDSSSSCSSGSFGGRPQSRTVDAMYEESKEEDRTPSEEVRHLTEVHIKELTSKKDNTTEDTKVKSVLEEVLSSFGLPPESQRSTRTDMSVCGSDDQRKENMKVTKSVTEEVLPSIGLPLESQRSARTDMSVCGSDDLRNGKVTREDEYGLHESTGSSNRHIYDMLKRISWVQGYYSQGGSITVYVDLEDQDPHHWEVELARETGCHPSKFTVKPSIEQL